MSQAANLRTDMIYGFGDFELDAARFELRHRGSSLELQPKVLRLLLHLVQQRDRAVSVEELLREVWPEEVVGQGSVRRAVLGARQALTSVDDSRPWIRNVPRYGYQFVAEVVVSEAAVAAHAARGDGPRPPDVQRAHRVLLGRESVLDLAEESFQQALSGTCRCVLIAGGPGLGKTRTIEELLTRAQTARVDAWSGRCTEVAGAPAFWPFIQLFREALRDRGPEQLRALLGSEGADVAGAISELRDWLPDLPEATPLSGESARFRLFDGIALFLRRAADARPLLLALDDLHRADAASLRLLLFLLRQLRRARILIVGAFRPEPGDSPEAALLLKELTHEASARCVTLTGLSRHEIARYVELGTGLTAPATVSELLHAQTAGNPLFLQHLIDSWRTSAEPQSAPPWETLTSAPMSQGLAGAIEQHLSLVTPPCRELLRVAAVLGTEFAASGVARIAALAPSDCSARLSEAVASGLIRELPRELGGYRFAHVLVRDALYAQLSEPERGKLHWDAACALEAHGIGENSQLLAEVTRHYLQSAPSHGASRALTFTLRAADSALRTLAYEQAAEDFDRALELLPYLPPDPRRRMTLLLRKGDALARFDLSAARAALFEAAALARELGELDWLVRAAALIASRPETGNVDAAQVELLREALLLLQARTPEDSRCVLLQALVAKSLLYAPDARERVSLALATLKGARQLSDLTERVEALTRCHEALPGPDHLQERLEITTELMSLAHRSGDTVALLRALAANVETSVERGDMQAVDMALDSMEVLAERVREPFYRWYSKVMRAMRDYVRGDIEGSYRGAHEAWHSSAPIGPELARHVYCLQIHPVLRMRGQVLEAEPFAREMMLHYPTLLGWSAVWGGLVCTLGRHEEARRCFERLMMQGAAFHRSESSVLASLAALSELCCKLRDAGAAKDLYTTLLPYAEHHGLSNLGALTYGPISRQLGALSECQGDVVRAEAHYRAALESARRMQSPVYESGIASQYARLLLYSGDSNKRGRAETLLSRAYKLAHQTGLTSILAVCRRLSARHAIGVEQLAAPADE